MTRFRNLAALHDFETLTTAAEAILFVFACGYEERSSSLVRKLYQQPRGSPIVPLCFTFPDYRDLHDGPRNLGLVRKLGIIPELIGKGGKSEVIHKLSEATTAIAQKFERYRVVVDYSSMPRSWYCTIVQYLRSRGDVLRADFWYVQGDFSNATDYPCVGFGEFNLFAGRPRVTRANEVHIFGLGFDSIRTYGIWNRLDSQFTCCLIGASPHNKELVSLVQKLNHEILLSANVVRNVRVDDFEMLLASVVDVTRRCSNLGDVCLVADGPKPLVVAMSIAPDIHEEDGVYSWHITHEKPTGYIPPNVKASNHVYGFCIERNADGGAAETHH